MSTILGIIPARAGSKGIPGKNYKPLSGKPLVQYSIDAALASSLIDKLIVTTDCELVKKIAEANGVEVIDRASDLSQDNTPMLPVLQSALELMDPLGTIYSHIVLLQPTCPVRTGKHIDDALASISNMTESIVSVYRVDDAHPGRMYNVSDGRMTPLFPELVSINRQDLPAVYHRNGAIYITPTDVLRAGNLYGKITVPFIMDQKESINIDSQLDWLFAELILDH